MKKAAIIPAMTLSLVMLASCDLFPDFNLNNNNGFDNLPDTLEEGFFYARNMKNSSFYVVEAKKLYEGGKCEIWAEIVNSEVTVTETEARKIADEYDGIIRPRILAAFGSDDIDILDYANELAGRNNKKLTILLLDIKDGYKTKADSFVAGYFFQVDFLKKGKYSSYCSNGRDMIYVDTNPGLKDAPKQAYATFAHELQHLVNYVTRRRLDITGSVDTWINEGLSAYAEYLYLEKNPEEKCVWLIDKRNTVKTGNNFFVWDNHSSEPYAIMDDYATVYLFFRWLYLQADTNLQQRIFREITRSPFNDYRAVTTVVGEDWEDLLGTWLAANHDPKNAVYGYRDDPYLQDGYGSAYYPSFKGIRATPIKDSERSLYPGEGVYSIIDDTYNAVREGNIRYGLLDGTTSAAKMLLTFNANTNNAKTTPAETGSLTGVSPSITVSRTAAEDLQSVEWNGPFVIDAQDVWGRNQDEPIRLLRR